MMVTKQQPTGWEQVGPSGRFHVIDLPMSAEAIALHGGHRQLFYAEFDTYWEPEAWKAYVYDPLKVLVAEQVPIPLNLGHLGVTVIKLEGEPPEGKNPLEDRE